MRKLFFVLGILVLVGAGITWEGQTGRTSTEEVVRTPRGSGSTQSVQVLRSKEDPSSNLRSEAVTVALIALGGALLLAAAFWDRLEEVGFAGVTLKLLDRDLVREVRERADDSDKALEAWELLLEKLREAERGHVRLSSTLTQEAADEALAEVNFNPERSISVGADGRVEIDGDEIGHPALRITTEDQYLPDGVFTERLMSVRDSSEEEENVQCLYALDVDMQEVLAAIIFELPAGEAPIVLRALGRRVDRPELQARCLGAALIGTMYLHRVTTLLGRKSGLFIETRQPDAVEVAALTELGFKVVAPDFETGLEPSEYWVQYPSG